MAIIRLALLIACLVCAVPMAAVAATTIGGPCSGPVVSAVDQYCQNVPTATGRHNHVSVGSSSPVGQSSSGRGQPSSAGQVSHSVANKLSVHRPGTPRRRPSALPATPPEHPLGSAIASGSSLPLPLPLLLIAAAIVTTSVIEAERRRRQRRRVAT